MAFDIGQAVQLLQSGFNPGISEWKEKLRLREMEDQLFKREMEKAKIEAEEAEDKRQVRDFATDWMGVEPLLMSDDPNEVMQGVQTWGERVKRLESQKRDTTHSKKILDIIQPGTMSPDWRQRIQSASKYGDAVVQKAYSIGAVERDPGDVEVGKILRKARLLIQPGQSLESDEGRLAIASVMGVNPDDDKFVQVYSDIYEVIDPEGKVAGQAVMSKKGEFSTLSGKPLDLQPGYSVRKVANPGAAGGAGGSVATPDSVKARATPYEILGDDGSLVDTAVMTDSGQLRSLGGEAVALKPGQRIRPVASSPVTAQDVETGKGAAKMNLGTLDQYRKSAEIARKSNAALKRVLDADPKASSGALQGIYQGAKETLVSLIPGLDFDSLVAERGFEASINSIIVDYFKELGARGLTDKDTQIIIKTLPSLKSSHKSRQELAKVLMKLNDRALTEYITTLEDFDVPPGVNIALPPWVDEETDRLIQMMGQ